MEPRRERLLSVSRLTFCVYTTRVVHNDCSGCAKLNAVYRVNARQGFEKVISSLSGCNCRPYDAGGNEGDVFSWQECRLCNNDHVILSQLRNGWLVAAPGSEIRIENQKCSRCWFDVCETRRRQMAPWKSLGLTIAKRRGLRVNLSRVSTIEVLVAKIDEGVSDACHTRGPMRM